MTTNAEFYAKILGNQHREAGRFFEEFEKLDREKIKTIVDVGCADGSLTAKIQTAFPNAKVYGLDISQSVIEFAKNQNHPNCKFILQDITAETLGPELEELKGKVDLVVSNFVLHWVHVSDRSKVLKNIHELLREDGRFMCILSLNQDIRPGLGPVQTAALDKWFLRFEPDQESKDWDLLFRCGKFLNVFNERHCMNYTFKNPEDYTPETAQLINVFRSYFRKPDLAEDEAKEALAVAMEPCLLNFSTVPGALPWADGLKSIKKIYIPYIFVTMGKAN